MEQFLICRTCLKANLSQTSCLRISNKTEINQLAIKDMLEIFMPEMDLELSEGDAVMCFPCIKSLKNAYIFKNICLKTEEKIYEYLHQYNIKLGKKINLSNIIQHEYPEPNFASFQSNNSFSNLILDGEPHHIISDDENETKLIAENSESNQIDLSSDAADISENQSEKEDKKVFTTKRKRSARSSKKYNYNSLKRSYTCDLCEYKAYRLDLLNTHKLKHDRNMLNVKEYKCEFCLYSTTRKRSLDRHLFTHKGKSPHLCKTCNKTFAEKYQLKLHSITHTGEELPHKCDKCGKGYLTKSYLKQHMETRHLTKNKTRCEECNEESCGHLFTRCYKCDTCELSFSDKRGLDAHKFTHTGGELPYKCLHCNFSTAWKGNLKKHLHNKH